jgi:SpoVK/Ycf46/Vps4 family AAA+-type ATPase/tetratricopeptide (TPR) repeat protein
LVTDELEELLTEAYKHLKHGRFRMALTAASKVYKQSPDNYKAAMCLARATLENGAPARALQLANIAVEISNDDVNSYLYRGYLLMRMSIFDGALSDLDYAILRKPDLISWAFLNKARTLAGLGRFFEALEEIEKANESDSEETNQIIKVREYLRRSLGYGKGYLSGIYEKKTPVMEEAEDALKEKEYWFSLWAARNILKTPSEKNDHPKAKLLELESLLGMFQVRFAFQKAKEIENEFKDNEHFQNIYQRILKFFPEEQIITSVEEPIHSPSGRTDTVIKANKFFNINYARTYDLIENIRSGRRTYLLQFSEETITYIGVEVIFENPFYNQRNENINGLAIWLLNDREVGRHHFNIDLEKNWKTVEFVQSWGTDTPGFWSRGQGRVDIYLDNNIVCSRWFLIGHSEVVNFEDIEKPDGFGQYERPTTEQPLYVKQTSLASQDNESLEALLSNLNTFIGLDSVKQSMQDFVAYLKFIKEREKLGLKTEESLSVHSIFLGNPGTGKTTIARLLGKIFKAMGLLKNGHVIEVDRTGLVGQYIGETAQKTEKVITEALGGILFIDEAYSLKKAGNQQDFGQEAIDVLLKRMEDHKGEFVVICAGYPEEMNSFINSNPGLKSRFTHYFNFDDYSPDELVEIFKLISRKEEYEIKEVAIELLKRNLTALYRNRDSSFGNARLIRNYFNEAKMQLSKRYLKLQEAKRSKEAMVTITGEDIKAIIEGTTLKEVKFGIDEENLHKAIAKLNALTGLQNVKNEIDQIIKLARLYIEQGEKLREKFGQHFVFLGSPGTGKTTVARIFSEIYSALGILSKGHLVEADRSALVSGYIGQTAQKTTEMIDRAIGGTLLLDEAYSLIKKGDGNGSDFGKEAIDTLLKRMEDDRGNFLVIATGYTEEMKDFLISNPGIKSRFTREIVFEDYTPDELLEISRKYIEQKGHILSSEIEAILKKYFNEIYRTRDRSFGNARLIRNLVDSILKNQLLRIADLPANKREVFVMKEIKILDVEPLIKFRKEKEAAEIQGNPELLDEYLNELSELTGLKSVKHSVEKLISSLKVAKLRKERGLKVIPKNLHSVFLGNPGTGKTTIARLLSKIYKEMGILGKGHLIEVDRTGLVAGYVGQTAVKTDKVIESAMGGTLFIDEAYSLARGGNDFGQEALDTLLKRMEDHAGKFVVIVAGYTEEMKEFIQFNPGLQSRFTNFFNFDDYTPRQMLEIALVISTKAGYDLDEGAWQLLLEIFNGLYKERDKSFGNARTVRNILYKAISNQEERILTLNNPTNEELSTIAFEDVEKISYLEFK